MAFIPPPPQSQALSTTTFKIPVLDGSITLPEIYDWHIQNSPDHPLFVYPKQDGTRRTILWPEAVSAVHTGAKFIQHMTGKGAGDIVAILASSETISYFTIMMSIMRANCIAFPISPRNSAAAVAHLVSKVGVKYILVGREQAMIDLANNALNIILKASPEHTGPSIVPVPLFEDMFPVNWKPQADRDSESLVAYNRKPTDAAIYLHSSGSTAFPKPILWTHHRFIQLSLIPFFGERDLTGQIFSLAVMPMYHGMGVLQLGWTAACGLVVGGFEPKSPMQIPTPDNLFHAAKTTDTDIVFCVPTFVEAWSRTPDYVKWLASRTGVLFGGGPLNKEIGDYMISQGVSIYMLYGSTEGGVMSPIIPGEPWFQRPKTLLILDSEVKSDYDWNYFRFPENVTEKMVPYGDNAYEFVMVENPYCRPAVINTKADGHDAYATSDLMVPHPTRPGYWKVFGRTDDQIMHSTGEKTNPGPLENILNQDPHVQSSVMFGRGRFQAGVIVDPKAAFKFDPIDTKKLAEFRNKLWSTVEKMNEYAPQHSRLFKEMILVANPLKPFTYTAKNTARRQAIISDYEEEIDLLYDAVEESTQTNITPPQYWDATSTLTFVRQVVHQVMDQKKISDDNDLFEHGCDSLQATWIRNTLLRALRDTAELDTRKTTKNFVYDHPTITRLALCVYKIAGGDSGDNVSDRVAHKVTEMRALVDKYLVDLPKNSTDLKVPSNGKGDVVVLTGSTGSLGSQVLASLALDDSIDAVYAFNRADPKMSLLERHMKIYTERGLPLHVLESAKVTLVEVQFDAPHLGLDKTLYDKIRGTVTHVIHNAWRVDFNLALVSFESSIRSMRTMVDLALDSPSCTKFLFVSSIGVLQNTSDLSSPIVEQEVMPEVAVGMGYAESKWVAESILSSVVMTRGLSTLTVRVGQVTGTLNGLWNPKEWFPSLVQASQVIGSLPTFSRDKTVSWIPGNVAAGALAELRKAPSVVRFAHLVHPQPTRWSTLRKALSTEMQLDVIDYNVWLKKLEVKCQNHSTTLNAAPLLEFFKDVGQKQVSDHETFGLPVLSTSNAISLSQSLKCEPLGEEHVKAWIRYWTNIGLLS